MQTFILLTYHGVWHSLPFAAATTVASSTNHRESSECRWSWIWLRQGVQDIRSNGVRSTYSSSSGHRRCTPAPRSLRTRTCWGKGRRAVTRCWRPARSRWDWLWTMQSPLSTSTASSSASPAALDSCRFHLPSPEPAYVCSPSVINSRPTFSPYLYNRVCSELTTRNPLSLSRLAWSRLSGHIQPSVNRREPEQTTYGWHCKSFKHNHWTSELQVMNYVSQTMLVYSTVYCCLSITLPSCGVGLT